MRAPCGGFYSSLGFRPTPFILVFASVVGIFAVLHHRWFHHTCYLGFFGWLCARGWSVGIMTTMPLEIPTMVLAGGRVFPALRHDVAFGASFLAFRVVYHAWLTYKWCVVDTHQPIFQVAFFVPPPPSCLYGSFFFSL